MALVGLTGAGKSTLASLIPASPADIGRVLIDGVDVAKYRLRSLRERIALVLQDACCSVARWRQHPLRLSTGHRPDVEDAAKAAHAHEFHLRLPNGYDTPLAEAGGSLSGGERQRLGIAGACSRTRRSHPRRADLVARRPLEDAVFAALRACAKDRTTVVIAHRLSTIRDANRILVLHDGRIMAHGTHQRAAGVSNELYRRMCARLSVGRSLDEPETVDELIQAI